MKYFALFLMCFPVLVLAQRLKIEPLHMGIDLRLLPPDKLEEPGLILELRTRELFECLDYELITDVKEKSNSIQIRLFGAKKPEACRQGMLPAIAKIPLMIPEGEYKLKISYQTFTAYDGTLVIDKKRRSVVEKGETELFDFYSTSLLRVRPGMVWGKIEFRDESLKEDIKNLLDEMESKGCKAENLMLGDYGPFYVFEVGKQPIRKLSTGTFEQPFVYDYQADTDLLKSVLKEAAQKSQGRIRISFYNSQGAEFFSWAGY